VEAMTLADKMVVLDTGVVQQAGKPIDFYQRPTNLFVVGFVGSPKMDFIAEKVDRIVGDRVTISGSDIADVTVRQRR
jgi:ABC-type sugar transport system ATPase subunit